MAVHELAGTKVRKEDYIDLKAIAAAYHTTHPDVADPHQQVRFGTSGHRGQAGNVILQFPSISLGAAVAGIFSYRVLVFADVLTARLRR